MLQDSRKAAKLGPVVTIDAGTTKGVVPQQGVAAERIVDEGVGLIVGPSRRSFGALNSFNPMFGRELVLRVAGENGEFGEIGLAGEVGVVEYVSHGSGERR